MIKRACCHNCIEFDSRPDGTGYCFIEASMIIDEWNPAKEKVRNGEEIPFGRYRPKVLHAIRHPEWQTCHRWQWNKRDME